MLEIEPPNGMIYVGRFVMDFNGRFWWQARATLMECSKRVVPISCLRVLLRCSVTPFV